MRLIEERAKQGAEAATAKLAEWGVEYVRFETVWPGGGGMTDREDVCVYTRTHTHTRDTLDGNQPLVRIDNS